MKITVKVTVLYWCNESIDTVINEFLLGYEFRRTCFTTDICVNQITHRVFYLK